MINKIVPNQHRFFANTFGLSFFEEEGKRSLGCVIMGEDDEKSAQ